MRILDRDFYSVSLFAQVAANIYHHGIYYPSLFFFVLICKVKFGPITIIITVIASFQHRSLLTS